MFSSLLKAFSTNPRQLILLDAFGALLSAFLLGIILVQFESSFGMPRQALYFLAVLPCFFALYDFCCYFLKPKNWKPYLQAIAIANFCYCLISIAFLFQHYPQLTMLGWIYFILELAIVLFIAILEFKTSVQEDVSF